VSGGIFISYRRQETGDLAGRLYDRLADRFGEARVFMDVDTIELGVDFTEVITRAVGTCEVLLAVIGPHWLTANDQDGHRRLDDPDDVVRLEIEAALARDVRVIPILVGGAVMPRSQELPASLGRLARRNGLSVRHDSFRSDMARLVAAIERVVDTSTLAAEPALALPPVSLGMRPDDVPHAPETVPVLRHSDMTPAVQRREQSWQAFIAAIEDRGFRRSQRSARLYYHPRMGRLRIKRMQMVIRIEEYRPETAGRDWQLLESYYVTAFKFALKIIDDRLASSSDD